MKTKIIIALLAIILASCTSVVAPTPTETPVPTITFTPFLSTPISTSTFTPIPPTASPLPTQPTIAVITPDPAQLERWKDYENVLANSILPFLPPKEVLCEWEILGHYDREVYVWVKCMSISLIGEINPGHLSASMPAVIHLGIDGTVQNVEVPGPGTQYALDIRRLFPPDVQQRIFEDLINYRQYSEHLEWRLEHPEVPPLIVLAATQIP